MTKAAKRFWCSHPFRCFQRRINFFFFTRNQTTKQPFLTANKQKQIKSVLVFFSREPWMHRVCALQTLSVGLRASINFLAVKQWDWMIPFLVVMSTLCFSKSVFGHIFNFDYFISKCLRRSSQHLADMRQHLLISTLHFFRSRRVAIVIGRWRLINYPAVFHSSSLFVHWNLYHFFF